MNTTPVSSIRGWVVTIAATGIGLLLGILYAWSVIKGGIPDSWGWTNADKALPYSMACFVFSLTMVPAGRLQDRFGPRVIATVGGILSGLGCIISGLAGSSLTGFVLGFGVVTGMGIGFGYSALTPAAIKWFPSQRTGLITGIVVAGFGLASVYMAPLSSWLLQVFQRTNDQGHQELGISSTMITLGLAISILSTALTRLIRNPDAPPPGQKGISAGPTEEASWGQMMRTKQFWLLWVMYFCGASAGLMFISVAQDLGKRSLGEWAFLAVVALAMGNAGGRILAGVVSDHIGRPWTLFAEFVSQALVVGLLFWISQDARGGWPVILLIVFLLGVNYGSNLALFPAACKDYFGLKGLGLNYGILYTSWGIAGLVMPWVNGLLRDATGKPDLSTFIIIAMLILAALLAVISSRLGRPLLSTAPRSPDPFH